MRTIAALFALALLVSCTSRLEQQPVKAATSPQPATDQTRPTLAQQKMCAEQAKKAFDDEQEQERQFGEKSQLANYTSHFDPQNSICYVRTNTTTASKAGSIVSIAVYDAFERRIFATYLWSNPHGKKYWEVEPQQCDVHPPKQETIHCRSNDEFNLLVEKWFGVAE